MRISKPDNRALNPAQRAHLISDTHGAGPEWGSRKVDGKEREVRADKIFLSINITIWGTGCDTHLVNCALTAGNVRGISVAR